MIELNRIYHGDTRALLKKIPDGSIHCCVTSPPYWGLRDYGVDGQIGLEETPEEFVVSMVKIFREVKRALRPDGTLWLNIGDSYAQDSKRGGKMGGKHAKGLHGTTGIGRNRNKSGLPGKNLVGIPWRVAFALQADGWYLRQDIIWAKPNPMPESVTDRCTKSHEYIFLMSKAARYFYDNEAIKEPAGEKGSANSFRGGCYVNGNTDNSTMGKRTVSGNKKVKVPSGWDTNKGSHDKLIGRYKKRPSKKKGSFNGKTEAMAHTGQNAFRAVTDTRNKRSVWVVGSQPFKKAHFATFPPKLIEPCILAGCPKGGTVLDPFFGSGTTGYVALENNRNFIGFELNPDYIKIAEDRIKCAEPMLF